MALLGADEGRPVRGGSGAHCPAGAPHLLWIEPLWTGCRATGAIGIWFRDEPPWEEALQLWGQRFAGRVGPFLPELPPCPPGLSLASGDPAAAQPCLFSPALMSRLRTSASLPSRRRPDLHLPRPVFLPAVPGAVGVSRELIACCASLPGVARAGVNVLLHGESGTGKEILARAIHLGSSRREGPFVGQNCAALPEGLFESELFGHKSGAFTGAAADKMGLLEAADGGTFFLDEIGDMPLPLQIKLLRVMQEQRVRRIGELESRPVDIRFVAATHKDLDQEIAAGRFRLDLYYRLKVVRLFIPPLRQRPEDIAHLLAYFLARQGAVHRNKRISERALATLQMYRWPGNVRELENEVSRFLALYPEEPAIRLRHLSPEVCSATGRSVDPTDLATLRGLDEATRMLEQYLIRKAIAAAGGRKAAAARRLGLSRQGLYKKIQRYGMTDLVQQGGSAPV